jgi:hypothetical protein
MPPHAAPRRLRRRGERTTAGRAPAGQPTLTRQIIDLQRAAGNRAVARLLGSRPLQRMPVLDAGVRPRNAILEPTAEEFADYEASMMLVPEEFLGRFADDLAADERESTLVRVGTLLRIMEARGGPDALAVAAYRAEAPGPAKLTALEDAITQLDAGIGAELDVPQQQPQQPQQAPLEVSISHEFLRIDFEHRHDGQRHMIRASLLRHGFWNIRESHPEEQNSLLMDAIRGDLAADGASLGEQVRSRWPYHGPGVVYTVASGRKYEVDGDRHFFPVEGPGITRLTRAEYLTLKAVAVIFRTPSSDRVARAPTAEALFERLGGVIPDHLASALAQIRQEGVQQSDLIDALATRHLKRYDAPSVTALLWDLGVLAGERRRDAAARERRDRRKEREAEDRARNDPR